MTEKPPFPHLFERERPRLLAALGELATGGIVETIQPIGSSSVPGLAGSGQVDIGLSIWPLEIDEAVLEGLGYRPAAPEDGAGLPHIRRFEKDGGRVQLWLARADSGFIDNALLIRSFLRHNEPARQDFLASRASKAAFFTRILPEAQRFWIARHGFSPLEKIADVFRGAAQPPGDPDRQAAQNQPAPFPWYISGGWALDLLIGRVTRVHRDVDVVVPFACQSAVQEHLLEHGWTLMTPLEGRLEPWPRHMQIQLPRHQVHAHRGEMFIDVLLTEIDRGVWRYRRSPAILRSVERMGLVSAGGIPYLAPELVLLFKSRNTGSVPRPQDQVDFELVVPLLEPERRAWLRWAITATQPDHPWLETL